MTARAMPEGFDETEAQALAIPDAVRKQLAEWGAAGGHAAARSMTPKAMKEKCRRAALVRWAKYRKGVR